MPAPPTISVSRFADFVVSDAMGQLAKLREIRRQYEQPYSQGGDFWQRWRQGVEAIHRMDRQRADVTLVEQHAPASRRAQYRSASAGYGRFWGAKTLRLIDTPKPANWTHDRLNVRVNPEWLLEVNGQRRVVKLHLKEKLTLNQRLANPLLFLLNEYFGPAAGGHPVAILDVHRGKLWQRRSNSLDIEPVLRIQAAAFLAGWDELDAAQGAA